MNRECRHDEYDSRRADPFIGYWDVKYAGIFAVLTEKYPNMGWRFSISPYTKEHMVALYHYEFGDLSAFWREFNSLKAEMATES